MCPANFGGRIEWNVSFAKHLATESDIEEWLRSYAHLGIKDSSLLHAKSKIYNTADDEKLAKEKLKVDNIAHHNTANPFGCSFQFQSYSWRYSQIDTNSSTRIC